MLKKSKLVGVSVAALMTMQIGQINAQELPECTEVKIEEVESAQESVETIEQAEIQKTETESTQEVIQQSEQEKIQELENQELTEENVQEIPTESYMEMQDALAESEEVWDNVIKDTITKTHNKAYCSFTLDEVATVTLMTQADIYSLDVNLLDSRQEVVWHSTIGNGESKQKVDLEAGSYTIEFAAAYYTGEYEYKLSKTTITTDEKEPNNAYLSAQNIQVNGESYRGFLGINDTVDIYEFELEAAGKLNLNFDTHIGVVEIELRDENDQEILSEKIEGGTERIPYSYYKSLDLSEGKYYFSVKKAKEQTTEKVAITGKYQFSFKHSAIKSDDLEPNNSITQAQKLELKEGGTLVTGYLNRLDTVDVYKFEVSNKDKIEIKYIPPFKDSVIQAIDEENNLIFKTSVYESFERTIEVKPGTYYIKIESEETGLYQLELTSQRLAKAKLYAFAERLYQLCQGRVGDSEGIEYWAEGLYKKEFTGAGATLAFIKSEEFQKRAVDDNAYVEILYQLCFDRQPDETGKKFYIDQLTKGVTRDYVLSTFINSEEYEAICKNYQIEKGEMPLANIADKYLNITQFVYRFYKTCLDRKPEVAELNYWVQELVNGKRSGIDVAKNFINSKEFQSKVLNELDYIEVLYSVFFGRSADREGMAYWKASLLEGKTRNFLLEAFSETEEFKTICNQYGICYKL